MSYLICFPYEHGVCSFNFICFASYSYTVRTNDEHGLEVDIVNPDSPLDPTLLTYPYGYTNPITGTRVETMTSPVNMIQITDTDGRTER